MVGSTGTWTRTSAAGEKEREGSEGWEHGCEQRGHSATRRPLSGNPVPLAPERLLQGNNLGLISHLYHLSGISTPAIKRAHLILYFFTHKRVRAPSCRYLPRYTSRGARVNVFSLDVWCWRSITGKQGSSLGELPAGGEIRADEPHLSATVDKGSEKWTRVSVLGTEGSEQLRGVRGCVIWV